MLEVIPTSDNEQSTSADVAEARVFPARTILDKSHLESVPYRQRGMAPILQNDYPTILGDYEVRHARQAAEMHEQ